MPTNTKDGPLTRMRQEGRDKLDQIVENKLTKQEELTLAPTTAQDGTRGESMAHMNTCGNSNAGEVMKKEDTHNETEGAHEGKEDEAEKRTHKKENSKEGIRRKETHVKEGDDELEGKTNEIIDYINTMKEEITELK